MQEISLCMIVKNEQDNIARCLESVKSIVDEIIIVDTGSTDKTKEICERYTDKIYNFKWIDDFAAARNYSFSKASKQYIMWLDADDYINEKNRDALLNLKSKLTENSADTYMCKYISARDENGNPTFVHYRERIFKRSTNPQWKGFIHEYITPMPHTEYTDIEIEHLRSEKPNPRRNLEIYQRKQAEGVAFNGRDMYYYGRELYYNRLYLDATLIIEKYLKGGDIWYVNAIEACCILGDCYKALGEKNKAIEAYCNSFVYDVPRTEILCRLGELHANINDDVAIFWYLSALNCRRQDIVQGFHEPDYDEFIPYIELSCCYYRKGDKALAKKYHLLAKQIKPEHSSIKFNEQFFKDS